MWHMSATCYAGPVTDQSERPLRADAARNVERILEAARTVFAETGPETSLETVAARAEVGRRTLFRRFPHREALVRAVLEQAIATQLAPVIERALEDDDPYRGLVTVMESALAMVDRERNTLAAASNSGALTAEVTGPVLGPLAELTERAQRTGRLRTDLTGDDIARVMGMLTNVLWGMEQGAEGWRRYLALVLDSLNPAAANPLPPAGPLQCLPPTGFYLPGETQ